MHCLEAAFFGGIRHSERYSKMSVFFSAMGVLANKLSKHFVPLFYTYGVMNFKCRILSRFHSFPRIFYVLLVIKS